MKTRPRLLRLSKLRRNNQKDNRYAFAAVFFCGPIGFSCAEASQKFSPQGLQFGIVHGILHSHEEQERRFLLLLQRAVGWVRHSAGAGGRSPGSVRRNPAEASVIAPNERLRLIARQAEWYRETHRFVFAQQRWSGFSFAAPCKEVAIP